jgi:predicted permease
VPSNLSLQLGMQEARLDARVPAFALLLSLATAVAAGLAPALQASRPDLEGVLRGSAPGADPVRRRRLLGSFVSAQIALGVVLLCGAGLVIENFRLLRGRPLGFDERGLYTAQLLLPERRYGDQLSRAQFVEQFQARLAAIPGVEGAGLVTVNPLRGGTWVAPMSVAGRGEMREMVNHRLITPGTLEAMKVPLLRGRRLLLHETEPVALVSARFAARYWPGEDPLGQRVRIAREGRPWMAVVGVVGDVHDAGEVHETWYLPYALHAASPAAAELNLMVRSALGEEAVSRAARKALAEVDPLLSLQDFAAMSRVRAENLAPDRLGAGAVSAFALLGLLLAAIGTYAVVAYALARREREIGIRLALGADPARVLRMLLREGAIRAAAGVAVGLGATFALHRILAALLPEVRTMDLRLTFGVALLFLAVAAIATWLPGRRALGIDPVISLRAE